MMSANQEAHTSAGEVPATLLVRVRSECPLSERVLTRLEDAGVLLQMRDGAYMRRSAR